MKYLSFAGLFALSLLSCARQPTLLVTVSDLPPSAQSIVVMATHMGMAEVADLDPYDLPMPPSSKAPTFLLRLPSGFSGDITVNVGAFMGTGGQGCLVGTGTANSAMFMNPDDTLTVGMMAATDTTCSGNKVVLSSAMPTLGNTNGGDTITLSGWGFKPGAKVYFGSILAKSVTYVSASQLQVTTPAKAGFGPTAIKVVNLDNGTVTRSDLFRFYSDTVDFTSLAFPMPGDFSNSYGFVFGIFDPKTTLDAAAVQPSKDQVSIVLTTGTTSIVRKDVALAPMSSPSGLAANDFNQDGKIDLVFNTQTTTPPQATILLNDGSGNFTQGGSAQVGNKPNGMVTTDFNADGAPDVAVANRMDSSVTILLGDGTGGFKSNPQTVNLKAKPDLVSIATSDFTGDGQPDILVADSQSGNIYVLANNKGDFSATPIGPFSSGTQVIGLVSTDINGDGKADVIVSEPAVNKLKIIENHGSVNIFPYEVATEPTPQNVWVADMNGDGYPDLVVPSQGSSSVDVFLNDRNTGFHNVTYKSFPSTCPMPTQIAIYDIDHDGRQDIGVLCSTGIGLLINHTG
jgi:hypothetical protein